MARSVAASHGDTADATGLLVRLLGEDAQHRSTLGDELSPLQLSITVDGTELVLSFHDVGEPLCGPPAAVLALVDLGLASGATGGIGDTGNLSVVRVPLPSHGRLLDDADLEVLDDDTPLSNAPVTIRELQPEDAPALSRCLYRCYGWTYPGADMYFPERVEAAIRSGKRIGEVAVDENGEVGSHWGAVFVAEGVVETGGTITDPRFRRRGIANQLGDRLLDRLVANGVRGRMREPVVTHSATQHIALREGATMVGLHIYSLAPFQQIGITDGLVRARTSLTVMYSPLVDLAPATIWVPADYEAIVRLIAKSTDWPRDFGTVRGAVDQPSRSNVTSSYDSLNQAGAIVVNEIGHDLVDAIDETLSQLRSAQAEVVRVFLPANDPALASVGAGLSALGLAFASFFPEYGVLGDTLSLQWLRDPEVDDSDWEYANEDVEKLAHMILAQARSVGDQATTIRRRYARRQELFAALPTTVDGD